MGELVNQDIEVSTEPIISLLLAMKLSGLNACLLCRQRTSQTMVS